MDGVAGAVVRKCTSEVRWSSYSVGFVLKLLYLGGRVFAGCRLWWR